MVDTEVQYLLVPMGYHSCVFFPIFLTFIYMAYP